MEKHLEETSEKLQSYENEFSELKFKLKDMESQLTESKGQTTKYIDKYQKEEAENKKLKTDPSELTRQVAVVEAKLVEAEQRYERRLFELKKINS